jgi:hypothetical protein
MIINHNLFIMAPRQKINGAFLRYTQNVDTAVIQIFTDTSPLIMNASDNFYNTYTEAYNAVTKNLTLIARYQNCAETFITDFNAFVEQFLLEYPQYFNQNLNFARVDDLMVDIFTGWSELYSGIAGCFSLAKNGNAPNTSTTPPRTADRYLDGDVLAIQCLDEVREIQSTFTRLITKFSL